MAHKFLLLLAITIIGAPAVAKDLLPVRYRLQTGDVQLEKKESLLWIDNSPVFLNPDKKGQHISTFMYKAQDLPDVPHLEVRYKGTKGVFKVEIQKGGQWLELATLSVDKDQWAEQKVELRDGVSAFANKKGEVELRIKSIGGPVESLEVDYLAITPDQKEQKTASLE